MLVLVSFGLVLLATILLVVGLLTDDGLNLIYLSIACSFIAAVVLYLAFRRARPKAEVTSEPPAPLLPDGAEPEDFADQAPARVADATTVQPVVPDAEPELVEAVNPGASPTADTEPAVATTTGDDWVDDDDWADAGDFEVEFPIADYDELTVAEIMPLLPQLYSDELDVVADRERAGKNRSTILKRLEELASTGTEADVAGDEPVAADTVDVDEDLDEVAETADEPFAPARAAARPAPQVPSLSDDDWDDDDLFPIADYDELTADQIIPLLAQLEDDELEDVKVREVAGQGRKSVITEIDRQLGLVDAVDDAAWQADEPADAPTPRPAPVAESPEGSVLAIAGYDGLTVAEIRPLLAGLSARELRAVLDHEVARDNRRTIVAEIERRLDTAEEAPAALAAPVQRSTKKAAASTRKAATKRSAAKKAPAKRAAKKASANHRFPIADYDELSVADIRPRLGKLSERQLRQVREREVSGAGRKTILAEIDRRLG